MKLTHILFSTLFLLSSITNTLANTAPNRNAKYEYLSLGSQEPSAAGKAQYRGLLVREIYRQALLISARDEMQLGTRDATLREPDCRANQCLSLDIKTKATLNSINVTVFQAGSHTPLKDISLKLNKAISFSLGDLVKHAEETSRTEFADLLASLGCTRNPHSKNHTDKIPPEIDKLLQEFSFTQQFAAIQGLHGTISEHGESPALIGALVRAYANLGELTSHHWTAAHKVFKARALLYAERLIATSGPSAWALWHRAYANALAGLHGNANQDLVAATKAANGEKPPAWVSLINCLVDYRLLDLEEQAKKPGPNQGLAAFLAMLAVDHSDSLSLKARVTSHLLTITPDCYRSLDVLSNVGDVSHLHSATLVGHDTLFTNMPQRLSKLPRLPQAAKTVVPQLQAQDANKAKETGPTWIANVSDALIQSSRNPQQRIEPSFAVLGVLLEETAFAQVARRCHFEREMLSTDPTKYVNWASPMVKQHPYRGFIESYTISQTRTPDAFRKCLNTLKIVDANLQMRRLVQALKTIEPNRGKAVSTLAYAHSDDITGDLADRINRAKPKYKLRYASTLQRVSPNNPLGAATFIEYNWNQAKRFASRNEEKYSEYPCVLLALADAYAGNGQIEDAKRCLSKCIQVVPGDEPAYTQLAEISRQQGDMAAWRRTLDAFLNNGEDSLDHSFVRCEIADQLMAEGKWKEALPYANTAAESWAGRAMYCAAYCNTKLQNWDDAELWIRRNAERYDQTRFDWYLWCMKTGHGDLKAARQLILRYFQETDASPTGTNLRMRGMYFTCEGSLNKAISAYEEDFRTSRELRSALHAALLADEMGNKTERDKWLREAIQEGARIESEGDARPALAQLAEKFQRHLDAGPGTTLDLKWVDTICAEQTASQATTIYYYVGRFLTLHGRQKQGIQYLQRCESSMEYNLWSCHLAGYLLRTMGQTS